MKILVTGKNGQLGSELQDIAQKYSQLQWIFVGKDQMDLTQSEAIQRVLQEEKPQMIINAAAYTAVDKAESDIENAELVNAKAVKTMADWAFENNAKIIHISTDYVFDGTSEIPLTEEAETFPINCYGKTKREGELFVQNSGADYVIIRTSWVYSVYGNNFVKTMLRLMNEREEISVVSDQIGTPTYAKDLAKVLVQIIVSSGWKSGVYHYSNEGAVSWFEFANAIKEINNSSCKVNAIPSSAFPTPAKRPHYSLLDKSKIKQTYSIHIPAWRESLVEMLNALSL